jgi:radical SAM protein with 4Fe4S-binding SPASM domain
VKELIAQWSFEDAFVAPTLIQLGLTYRCNLNCPHCYALYRRTRPEFSETEVRALIDAAYDLGTMKIVYSHGENLIRKDFHAIARYIADKGMFQTLMSNGFYLQTIEQIRRLEDTGIQKVMISIDSVEPAEHNQNRGHKTAYDWATSAISKLKEHTGLKVGISMAIDRRNFRHVQAMADLAIELGVDHLSYMQVRPNQPHSFQAYDWSDYEGICRELYELILRYRPRLDVYTHDPFMLTIIDDRLGEQAFSDFEAHNVCNAGRSMMSIAPDGEVSGCNFIERTVGNCRQEPLAAIWDRLLSDCREETEATPCAGCSGYKQCRTGCRAFHLPWNDRYDKRCAVTRFAELAPGLEMARR